MTTMMTNLRRSLTPGSTVASRVGSGGNYIDRKKILKEKVEGGNSVYYILTIQLTNLKIIIEVLRTSRIAHLGPHVRNKVRMGSVSKVEDIGGGVGINVNRPDTRDVRRMRDRKMIPIANNRGESCRRRIVVPGDRYGRSIESESAGQSFRSVSLAVHRVSRYRRILNLRVGSIYVEERAFKAIAVRSINNVRITGEAVTRCSWSEGRVVAEGTCKVLEYAIAPRSPARASECGGGIGEEEQKADEQHHDGV